jgi:hypothetical protein
VNAFNRTLLRNRQCLRAVCHPSAGEESLCPKGGSGLNPGGASMGVLYRETPFNQPSAGLCAGTASESGGAPAGKAVFGAGFLKKE